MVSKEVEIHVTVGDWWF